MHKQKSDPEKHKLTIRLSRNVVKNAKVWAAAYEEDLQDFVERALWEAMRNQRDLTSALLVRAAKEKAKKAGK